MVAAADEPIVLTDEYDACVEVEAEELRRRELRRREGEKREAMVSKRVLWAILWYFWWYDWKCSIMKVSLVWECSVVLCDVDADDDNDGDDGSF